MPATLLQRQNFILFTRPIFEAVENEFNIAPRIALVQSALESNWGVSALAVQGKNIFSLTPGQMWVDAKVHGRDLAHLPPWSDGDHPTIYFETTEYSRTPPEKIVYWEIPGDIVSKKSDGKGGSICQVRRHFRQYESWDESANDWASKLSTEARYAQTYLAAVKGDVWEFANAILKAGFATDPAYAKSLLDTNSALEQMGYE